ncbi:hypothetical protein V2J09_011126 [Rumex salicifolius]
MEDLMMNTVWCGNGEKEKAYYLLWVQVVVTAVVGLWVVWAKLAVQLWWRPTRIRRHFTAQGVRGPPPHPLLGNMKEIGELMAMASAQPMSPPSHNILPRVLPFYHHWKKIYGATFLIWFGPTARFAISDPALIREIFATNSESYEKYESHPLVKKLEGNGLISLKGELWAHRRKIISPIFHMENLKLMMPLMAKSVADMLEKWSLICNSGKAEIDVSEWFQNLTGDVITRTIFGGSYEDGKAIYKLQTQQMVLSAESFQKVFIPGYKFLPTGRNRAIWRLDKQIQALLTNLIEKKREVMEGRDPENESTGPRDLLEHLILESLKEERKKGGSGSGMGIRGEDIVEECKSFFFAGKHTTSNMLIWTTVLLAMHPQWQQLAREEVLRVCGARETPTKEHVSNLKTLRMVIYETLRLYPPAVATIRRTKANVELGGYKIPKATELLIPILALHHDGNVWGPDVHEFNPGRFSQGLSQAAKHLTAYMPFGLGARQCIGQNLAILQVKLAMAMILQRFSFDVSPNYKHAPTVLMLLYPQFDAPIVFRKAKVKEFGALLKISIDY